MTGADKTTEAGQPGPLGIVLSTDGLGAGAEARCWCHTCRPITFADMRMVLCPTCGDKRCLHALSHAAPCAKTDIYAHNAWVERILLRSQRAPENSAPDEVGMTALGAWGAPNAPAQADAACGVSPGAQKSPAAESRPRGLTG